jgi:hypothetical protein
MKNVSGFIVLTAALGMLLFLSCKKEYSCEDCIGNNHPPLAVAGERCIQGYNRFGSEFAENIYTQLGASNAIFMIKSSII